MAGIDEVRLWAIDHGGGIGHVVAATGVWGRYVHTLCERLGNYETTAERPKRVCRACRERLAQAWPHKEMAPERQAPKLIHIEGREEPPP
jgi:hypothetical protein